MEGEVPPGLLDREYADVITSWLDPLVAEKTKKSELEAIAYLRSQILIGIDEDITKDIQVCLRI